MFFLYSKFENYIIFSFFKYTGYLPMYKGKKTALPYQYSSYFTCHTCLFLFSIVLGDFFFILIVLFFVMISQINHPEVVLADKEVINNIINSPDHALTRLRFSIQDESSVIHYSCWICRYFENKSIVHDYYCKLRSCE